MRPKVRVLVLIGVLPSLAGGEGERKGALWTAMEAGAAQLWILSVLCSMCSRHSNHVWGTCWTKTLGYHAVYHLSGLENTVNLSPKEQVSLYLAWESLCHFKKGIESGNHIN
jgi:hypothetical protein